MSLTPKEMRTFATVLADGGIHITVPAGTAGAQVRKFKTSDGKEGEKTEFVYQDIKGKISKIEFRDGNFGTQLQLTITDGDEKPVVLSLGCASNYGEDMMKKLPNIDLDKPVKIAPYSFTDDKGKMKKGVTVYQHDGKEMVKIANYFFSTSKKVNLHGFPNPKQNKNKKPLSKEQWKLYFGECREFLIEFVTEHFKLDKVAEASDADLEEMADEASKAMDDDK